MAPPTYNAALHHIGLGPKGGANYGWMLDGGYRKERQREALGAQEFGGSADIIGQTPSVSRWTQDAFEGGMFAYDWGHDEAMFADCTNMMPGPQSRSLFSCPPMYFKKAFDPDTFTGWTTDVPKSMFMIQGWIYLFWDSGAMRYHIDTDANTTKNPPTNATWIGAEYNSIDQIIWACFNSSVASSTPSIQRIKTDLTDPTWDSIMTGPSDAADLKAYGFTIYNNKLLLAAGRKVWLGVPPDRPDPVANGTIEWVKLNQQLQGRWRDHVPYNGGVYILCNDGSFRSNIAFFDGTDLLPVTTLPFNFYGKAITEYGGRIFVSGTGTDVNGGEHFAELYEVTGSSTRLVRSFTPETRNFFQGGLAGEWPRSFDDLAVFEGLLWMCQKGKRLIAYDLTSDGFFGASEIQSNTDLNFSKMVTGRGRLWAFGIDDSDDLNHGIYRIAQPADTVSAWNPTFITSDFTYEPAMKKRWGKLRVLSRYGGVSSIDYSINSGESWTTAGTVTVSNAYGKVYYSDVDLAGIAASEHIRFRIKLTSTGDAGDARTYHRELVAYTVSFVMGDTGKKAWSFTINGSAEIETRDAEYEEGTTGLWDISDVRDTIWGWSDSQTSLTLTDLDGSTYDVQLVGLAEVQPHIAPDHLAEGEPEALYAVTLVEV